MKKALVLGATGFIGGHIVRQALSAGWQVAGLRRNQTAIGHLQGLAVDWRLGNLEDPESLQQAMHDIEVVFHCAGFYPSDGNPRKVPEYLAYARQEIDHVLTACQTTQVQRLVYTSSLTTIGHPPAGEKRLADERDFYQPGSLPKSAYYEAKILMERAVLDAAGADLDAVVLNPTAVFGPGDVHLTLSGLLLAVARGQMIAWLPGIINVIDVRDVAAAHLAAARAGRRGERYILGGHNLSVRAALTQAAQVAGVPSPRFEIPLWALGAVVRAGDLFPGLKLPANHLRAVPHWQGYHTAKALSELGLPVRPFADTVRDALAWLREVGQL